MYALIAGPVCLLLGAIAGYFIGRKHTALLDKIKDLANTTEPGPEPEKPGVTPGAYAPVQEPNNTPEKKHGAGLVETKTPELLDWESQNELAKLEHGG